MPLFTSTNTTASCPDAPRYRFAMAAALCAKSAPLTLLRRYRFANANAIALSQWVSIGDCYTLTAQACL